MAQMLTATKYAMNNMNCMAICLLTIRRIIELRYTVYRLANYLF